MVWQLELALFVMLIVAAIVALEMRDLIASIAALTVYSFLAAVLLAMMGAVDVALTEASLGAGITGVLLIGGVALMRRRSAD
jgi:energy-converting hydrogenase B subunit D